MKTNSNREKAKTAGKEIPISEVTDQARKNYEQAMRTGLKMSEEAARWWTNVISQAALTADWQKRMSTMTSMASGMLPLAQRRMEDMVDLLEKNSRAGTELMKKAMDAAQSPVVADSQAKWMEFWTASMGALRTNAEAVTEMSTRAIDSWVDFVRKNAETADLRGGKAI